MCIVVGQSGVSRLKFLRNPACDVSIAETQSEPNFCEMPPGCTGRIEVLVGIAVRSSLPSVNKAAGIRNWAGMRSLQRAATAVVNREEPQMTAGRYGAFQRGDVVDLFDCFAKLAKEIAYQQHG